MTVKQWLKYYLLLPFAYKTKADRLIIYVKMRSLLISSFGYNSGFCSLLFYSIRLTETNNLRKFPELYCQKPKTAKTFWFSGSDPDFNNKRLAIIEQAIKMCQPKLNNYAIH